MAHHDQEFISNNLPSRGPFQCQSISFVFTLLQESVSVSMHWFNEIKKKYIPKTNKSAETTMKKKHIGQNVI